MIDCGLNENDHHRGFHIVVLDPTDGEIIAAKVFDTYSSSEGLDWFLRDGIPHGYIVIAACKDDGARHLSERGKQWFANMGSTEIWNL